MERINMTYQAPHIVSTEDGDAHDYIENVVSKLQEITDGYQVRLLSQVWSRSF